MATPVRTLILNDLKAALAAITISGGYLTDVRAVLEGPQSLDSQPSPLAWIDARREVYQELANPRLTRVLPVTVALLVECQPGAGDGPRTEVEKLLADAEKAILADRTRGGKAVDTRLVANTLYDAEPGLPWVEIDVEMQITYRTPRTDPFTPA